MDEARFSGDIALFESLGGDALASLHLARLKSGPVVIAQTFHPDAPLAAQLSALVTAADRLKAPKVGSLLAISHTQTSPGPVLAYALFSGQLLSVVLEKARAEGMPLAADLALLVADKVADALTHLPAGSRHPLISTSSVMLSYDGDVTVIDVPLASALAGQPLGAELLGAERAARLHKSTLTGKPSPRAEVWQLGAMILEMVSGEPFSTRGDIASRVTELCKAQEISADIRDVIERALVENSEAFRSVEEMKEVVGKLIYQGAYAPSTFSLAFFMHTLYRGEDEKFEARVKSLAAARLEFPAAALPPAAVKPAPAAAVPPAPRAPAAAGPAFAGFSEPESEPAPYEPPGGKKRPVGLIAAGAAVLLLLIGGGWWMTRGKSGGDAKKLQEMETRQKALEAENLRLAKESEEFKKQQADLKAKEEAQHKLISESKNSEEKKQAEAELAKLQTRKQALEDERKKQQEDDAAKQAALLKKDADKLKPPPAAPAGAADKTPPAGGGTAAPPPTAPVTETAPPPAPPPEPVKEIYTSAEVDQPATVRGEVKAEYPRNGRGGALVILRLTVDESGTVTKADVAKSDTSGPGFNEAATAAAMKQRFAPAIKDGRPVKSFVTKTYKFGAS